jgi:hypothetical protein
VEGLHTQQCASCLRPACCVGQLSTPAAIGAGEVGSQVVGQTGCASLDAGAWVTLSAAVRACDLLSHARTDAGRRRENALHVEGR